ncbi:MAG: GDP-L-fucose synthase family protein [Gammaproteobacteria bacterium]
MDKTAKIYVAGHAGLVGSAVCRKLKADGYYNTLTRNRAELDLTAQAAVQAFFRAERPEFVFLCAAKVGGIWANWTYPAQFIYQNLAIQTNVIHEAKNSGVKRLLFFGSSCIYPRDCAQPIREEYLLSGHLEHTNRPYAVAKIAGIEMCWAYNREYGAQYLAAMPTNLYGPGDDYDLETSHVLPALIRKMHEGKIHGASSVTLWGTGQPKREFLYSDDLADAAVYLMNLPDNEFSPLCASTAAPPLINIGYGEDLTIRELAALVRMTIGFKGDIEWDLSKPDGTPRKLLDVTRLHRLGWKARIGLGKGIGKAYEDYLDSQSVRVKHT